MKLRKFNIDLDTKLKKSNPGIEVVQGDNISNILEINLFQDDEPYLLDNLTILTVFNKSDNTTVIQSSEDPELPILIKDNKATITLKSNSISASGLVVAEVSIYGGNDERLTSQRFTFYVRESLLSDDVIESTNEFPVLVSLIKDVRGLLEKQIEMVESETIRVSNEVERIKTHEKLLILQSNLETLQISLENTEEQRQINESARENLKTSLESLQGDLLALEIEIANSIDIANQSAINADDKANLAQTATDNINTKLIEANNLIDEIVTDEQERILAENERISNENERIENEGIRDTEFTNKINDFVAETERVESEYPLRLTDVENSHTALKEDYVQQRQEDNLKVATVEKGLNDYKSTIASVNVNQEAKQKVTGYGVVSLPKNTANGQVSSIGITGLTATNLIKNGNFSNGIDNWSSLYSEIGLSANSDALKVIKLDTNGTVGSAEQFGIFQSGRKYFIKYRARNTGNYQADNLTLRQGSVVLANQSSPIINTWYNLMSVFTASSTDALRLTLNGLGTEKTEMEAQEVMAIDLTAQGLESLTVEECDKMFANYFDGTKSTISASRLKSVNENLVKGDFKASFTTAWQAILDTKVYKVDQSKPIYINFNVEGDHRPIIILFDSNMNRINDIPRDIFKSTSGVYNGMNIALGTTGYGSNINTANINNIILEVLPYKGVHYIQLGLYSGSNATARTVYQTNRMISQTSSLYEPYIESTQYLPNVGELRSLPNGVCDEIRVSGGKAELVKSVSDTMEELAEPIITPIEVSGTLLSNPSGTVYVENIVADAGIYTTKFDIKELQLPIKSIDKLIKYNSETGVQTVLDTTLAVINADKKSFTHPNLIDKDMVFVDYYYDVESTLGETTIEYLDSRHTIKDTTNNKFYSWDIKSTNGVPTVDLTEVL